MKYLKKASSCLFCVGMLLAIVHGASAQTVSSTTFTYQGRVQDNGTNYTGAGLFQFALVTTNGSATMTWWSNDGTSANGSEPSAAVAIGVTNGLFTVALGNSALANMAVLPALVFTQANLQLKIWFNDSVNGFGSFPAQPLTPAPYAVVAGNLTGSLPLAQLPASVVTNGSSGVTISGNFTGNGAGVTNVPLAALNGGGTLNWGNFPITSSPSVGNEPISLYAADMNGDGKVDLIAANYLSGTITVLTNNGSGSFGSNTTVTVGSYPHGVTAADVNGDGKLDLICVLGYNGSDTMETFTNNGTGGFVLASTSIVNYFPVALTAVDVNGDGRPDIITAGQNSGNILVLTNVGGGIFASNASYTTGAGACAVTSADVNGDGKPDLICANYGASTVSVLTNNGSGGFVTSGTYPMVGGASSVAAADVNRDGHLDLICANYNFGIGSGHTITVLTNNGAGIFVSNAVYTVGNEPVAVVAADVNGDGYVDLVSANITDGTLSVLTNDGSGDFTLRSSPQVGTDPLALVAADVNGDGHVDLIAANGYGGNTLSVLLNTPAFNGTFSGSVPNSALPTDVALTDAANQTFTGQNNFSQSPAVDTPYTVEGDVTLNTNVYIYSHAIYLRGETGADHNHGLAYCGPGVTNFAATVLPNGPVLWGYSGGVLGVMNGGAHAVLTWTNGGVYVNGGFAYSSDRNVKSGFAAVDSQDILQRVAALPVTSWTYTNNLSARHIGPMAQDFHAAFKVNGEVDNFINIGDEAGVALAAIQGLDQKLDEKDAEIQSLKQQNDALADQLRALAAAVKTLTDRK